VYGQSSTATATVTAPFAVAGNVQFSVDGNNVGSPVAVAGGEATSPVLTGPGGASLIAGPHTVAANFIPTTPGVLSAEGQVSLVVEKAGTTTSVEIQPGKLRATVAAQAPGAGEPTGTVTFIAGDDTIDAPLEDGVAEVDYEAPDGIEVSAEYSGDDNFTVSGDSTTRRNPTITATVSSSKPASRFGWYSTPVTVSFACDQGSAALTADCPGDVVLTQSEADAVVERTIHAEDGGIATSVTHVQLDLDKPKVRIKGVKDGKVYNKPPRPSCVATDALSGVDKCKLTKTKNGNRVRVVAVATDRAGNSAAARAAYRIAKPAKPKPIVVRGAEQRNRFFLVDSGRSYALVVHAKKAPRYFFATPYPQKPYERGPRLDQAGKDRWVIRISITDAMAARATWNVGLKYGGKLHVVHLRIR
jgi:hypothetical protein